MTPAEAKAEEEHLAALREWSSEGYVGRAPEDQFFVLDEHMLDGPEHGLRDGATLCGMPSSEVFAMRHYFHPEGCFACSDCAKVARTDRT